MNDDGAEKGSTIRLTDAAPAAVMLVLSVVMVTDTWPLGVWQGFTPGPAFFPLLIGGFASVLAVLLLIRAARGKAGEDVSWPDCAVLRTIAAVYGALLGFFFATPYLGMIPAIVVFLVIVMIGVLRQPVIGSLCAAAITTGFIYLIFAVWLTLPLPEGILGL